jgi:type II secretory pathway pseudopilin PulG
VGGNTDEGWYAVGNGNQHPGKLLLVAGAVPVGMLAAIAIPNFVKARGAAQKNACINNLRQIDGAKQQWALENKKPESATPQKSDLMMYFKNDKFPVCPAGGNYTINSVDSKPTCSVPDHEMP